MNPVESNKHGHASGLCEITYQALGPTLCQTFARLHKAHVIHTARKQLDWVQSALVYIGYEAYDQTR